MDGDGEVAGIFDALPFGTVSGQRGYATYLWFWNASSIAHFATGLRVFVDTILYDLWYY